MPIKPHACRMPRYTLAVDYMPTVCNASGGWSLTGFARDHGTDAALLVLADWLDAELAREDAAEARRQRDEQVAAVRAAIRLVR